MIERTHGDLFAADVDALVNPVNCAGVMGRGLAAAFKRAFADNFRAYAAACDRGELQPGRMFVHDRGAATHPRYIVNFPTKRHWRNPSRLDDITSGLVALRAEILSRRITSIAVPALGCGLGGLPWPTVSPLLEQSLASLTDVRVLLYEP
jgi:O-acetyl-ADP-ribose deacetylase (regulator of RNase III)